MEDVHSVVAGTLIVVPEGFPLMRDGRLARPAREQQLRVVAVEHEAQRDPGSYTVRLMFGERLWAEYDSRDRVDVVSDE
jgi:hypothetical protein